MLPSEVRSEALDLGAELAAFHLFIDTSPHRRASIQWTSGAANQY